MTEQELQSTELKNLQSSAKNTDQEPQSTARITSEVPQTKPDKHPGRIAAGKRLAEFNRKAKRTNAPQPINFQPENLQQESMSGIYLLSIAGFIISLFGLYYKRREVLAFALQNSNLPASANLHVDFEPVNSKRAGLVDMD